MAAEYLGGIGGREKNAVHASRVLGGSGGDYQTEWIPWYPVQGKLPNHTKGPDISDTI